MPNLQAAKLEAILRVMLDADTDEELHRARRQAAAIAALSDDDIEALLREYGESPHEPAGDDDPDDDGDPRHGGSVVRHLRPGRPARHARDPAAAGDAEGAELARFYAALFNAWEAAEDGREVAEGEAHRAMDELHPLGWSLDRSDTGEWVSLPLDALEAEADRPAAYLRRGLAHHYAAQRAPKGGVTIAGKAYRGGQFIPSKELAKADPATQEKVRAAGEESAAATRQRRAERGPVGREDVEKRLAGHAGTLSDRDRKTAAAGWRGIVAYHGDDALHRLHELTDLAEEGLRRLDGKTDQRSRNRAWELRRSLAKMHHMVGLAKEEGYERSGVRPQGRSLPRGSNFLLGKVFNVDPRDLNADPTRFQFKLKVDKQGVTDELKGVRKWNPDFAGVLAVWKDPADGKTYVVNGHHRYELANRLGVRDMAVRYIDAGSAKEARAVGALINIAEGRGTALDAAKFMRDTGLNGEEMQSKYGVSVKGKVAADAAVLAKCSDTLFNRVLTEQITPGRAMAIASVIGDYGLQNYLLGRVDRHEEHTGRELSDKAVAEMARELYDVEQVKRPGGGGGGLFGDMDEPLLAERGEIKAFVRGQLGTMANDFAIMANARRAAAVAAAGNQINVEGSAEVADALARVVNKFDQAANLKGPISDTINQLAADLRDARSEQARRKIRQEAIERLKPVIEAELNRDHVGDRPAAKPADRPALDEYGRKPWVDPPLEVSKHLQGRDAEIEQETQKRAREQYDDFKKRYLAAGGNADYDEQGQVKSVCLNTDEWRPLFPEYNGVNAGVVHEACSYLNKRLFYDALKEMKGKGNGSVLVLAGGGGSGKGTATKGVIEQSDYPIRLDQVSDSLPKLLDKLKEGMRAGYGADYVFVDRKPEDAWQGVVGRAMSLAAKGKPPRTVPLKVALEANLKARKVASELLKGGNKVGMDGREVSFPVRVIDNNRGQGRAELIKDAGEALTFLDGQKHNLEELQGRLQNETLGLFERGELPAHVAAGLVGQRAVDDRRLQQQPAGGAGGGGQAAGRGAEGAVGGVPAEGQGVQGGQPAGDRAGAGGEAPPGGGEGPHLSAGGGDGRGRPEGAAGAGAADAGGRGATAGGLNPGRPYGVGEKVTYTGRAGAMPAEFRGYHTDPETGGKAARVIVTPPGEPPFEASVPVGELSRPGVAEGRRVHHHPDQADLFDWGAADPAAADPIAAESAPEPAAPAPSERTDDDDLDELEAAINLPEPFRSTHARNQLRLIRASGVKLGDPLEGDVPPADWKPGDPRSNHVYDRMVRAGKGHLADSLRAALRRSGLPDRMAEAVYRTARKDTFKLAGYTDADRFIDAARRLGFEVEEEVPGESRIDRANRIPDRTGGESEARQAAADRLAEDALRTILSRPHPPGHAAGIRSLAADWWNGSGRNTAELERAFGDRKRFADAVAAAWQRQQPEPDRPATLADPPPPAGPNGALDQLDEVDGNPEYTPAQRRLTLERAQAALDAARGRTGKLDAGLKRAMGRLEERIGHLRGKWQRGNPARNARAARLRDAAVRHARGGDLDAALRLAAEADRLSPP